MSPVKELSKKDSMIIRRKNPETVAEAILGTPPLAPTGETWGGVLGDPSKVLRKPDTLPEVENLSPQERARKSLILRFLNKWVQPNELSVRSNPTLDRRSMVGKFKRLTLKDLTHFLPQRLQKAEDEKLAEYVGDDADLPLEEQDEIQQRYKDLSP